MVHHEIPAIAEAANAAGTDQGPRFEQRMWSVVEHAYTHLDEPLDLLTLADIAHRSPHYWQRTDHALYGETMASTSQRQRLHRAAGWPRTGRCACGRRIPEEPARYHAGRSGHPIHPRLRPQ